MDTQSNPLADRLAVARRRIRNILGSQTVSHLRTLEQKIADAGPNPQRCDPHVITNALRIATAAGDIQRVIDQYNDTWFHLPNSPQPLLNDRLALLSALHHEVSTGSWTVRLGQSLEIAVYRALLNSPSLAVFGAYTDLSAHPDDSLYSKEEPPSTINGRSLPAKQKLDFVISSQNILAGIEVKNKRPWFYPKNPEIKELIRKSITLGIVPILIARRVHFTVWEKLVPLGLIVHQTYRQRYPNSEFSMAQRASDKSLLGYHDIILGNEPDPRLQTFISKHLPAVLPEAHERFLKNQSQLLAYCSSS